MMSRINSFQSWLKQSPHLLETSRSSFLLPQISQKVGHYKSVVHLNTLIFTGSKLKMMKSEKHGKYTQRDFAKQSENEFYRYLNTSNKVGHALIQTTPEGKKIAYQFDYSADDNGEVGGAPTLRPLTVITQVDRFGMERYEAESPGGTQYAATRHLDVMDETGEVMKIAYFSPKHKKKPVFWGSDDTTPIFRSDLPEEELLDLKAEVEELSGHIKGGKVTHVRQRDVLARDAGSRGKTQNAVMGYQSAKDYVASFLEERRDELHPEMVERLERSINAVLRDQFHSQHRPEWLHALGYSLTPVGKDPQVKENLGAAPKWCNTEMMIIERVAKWFASNAPEAIVKVKPLFHMLLDTEMIRQIQLDASVGLGGRALRLFMDIDPYKKYPIFRKASDVAQTTLITHSYLNARAPRHVVEIRHEKPVMSIDKENTMMEVDLDIEVICIKKNTR